MPGENWTLRGRLRNQEGVDEIRAKVLYRASQHVESVGLSLGVDAALIEKLSAKAEITPAQFAQIWPSDDEFLADLVSQMTLQAQTDRADPETLLSTWQHLSSRIDELRSIEGRRGVLIDIIRTSSDYNFEAITTSGKWRTYAALSATIMSWPESEARTRVLDALRESELSFVETMESFYRNVLPTIGYRLKPVFNNDYQPFVVAAASVIEGLGIVRAAIPAVVETRFDIPAENGSESWSIASLAFIGVVDSFIEADPTFDPDDAISRLSGGMDVTPQSDSDSGY